MEQWFIYILECSDKTLYIGVTNDLDERLKKHNAGKGAKYTRGRGPVKMLFSQSFDSKSDACKEEYRLKKLTREEKFELIKSVLSE